MKLQTILVLIILLPIAGYTQSKKSRMILGEEIARKELEKTLMDSTLHNVITKRAEIIADSSTAVAIAESFLFKIYGKKNVKDQQPYEIYKIKNYWSISGTLPEGWVGGTFLIIMDARDAKVLRITHGK